MRLADSASTPGDLEPLVKRLLSQKASARGNQPYRSLGAEEVRELLRQFFAKEDHAARVDKVMRVGGGASKEQFSFSLSGAGHSDGRYLLRMDPLAAIVETDREREFQTMRAMADIVPVPKALLLDPEGRHFGQPAAIMTFVEGTTKPSAEGGKSNVTGMGTFIPARFRALLGPQFINHLAAIHAADWRQGELAGFDVPDADPRQAARWQANWWTYLWHQDRGQPLPMAALAKVWLQENLPSTFELVLVHADYRTGNYLFDEQSGEITAILDWEFAHIGDYHEDLGWVVQRIFGSSDGDRFYVSGLLEREEFLDAYRAATGRIVDAKALKFYEVLGLMKMLAITLATCVKVARNGQNHQGILATWLSTAGHIFTSELCDLLERD